MHMMPFWVRNRTQLELVQKKHLIRNINYKFTFSLSDRGSEIMRVISQVFSFVSLCEGKEWICVHEVLIDIVVEHLSTNLDIFSGLDSICRCFVRHERALGVYLA
jgi:hypothetical protein